MRKQSNTIYNTIYTYTLSGIITGLLEYLVSYLNHHPPLSTLDILLSFALAGGIFGICGMFLGAVLTALDTQIKSSILTGWLFFATVSALNLLRYNAVESACIVGVAVILAAIQRVRPNSRLLLPGTLWAAFLYLLFPMFSGKAMQLVFSEAQVFLIFVSTLVCLLLFCVYLVSSFNGPSQSQLIRISKVLFGLTLSISLCIVSSVFFVRLWGFHTMEYLQIAFIVIQIMLVGVVLHFVFCNTHFISKIWPAISVIFLVVGSTFGMEREPVRSFVIKDLPNTGIAVTYLANLWDFDHDGFSPLFHFGDCNDRDLKISPAGIDWPGDGKDQNCFNGDLKGIEFPYFNIPITITPPTPAPHKPRIVVFEIIDTLRADYVNYDTANNSDTPELARIASQSINFSNAYSQANNTLESFPFMFHVGFRTLPRYNDEWTVVHNLKSAHIPSAGVLQLSTIQWWDGGFHDVLMGFDETSRPDISIRLRSNEENGEIAIKEILDHKDQDFFLFVHFESLHDYATKAMEGGRMIDQGINISELVSLWQMDKLLDGLKHQYREALKGADTAAGKIWDTLKGLEDKADILFVLAADHGEEFHEHGGLFHMGTLYQELLRVPLIVYTNGVTPRVDSTPVGLYRIPNTALKFLGFNGKFLDEMNLLQTPMNNYPIFSYFAIHERGEQKNFQVMSDNKKLIYDLAHNRTEMYDLTKDPTEQHDIDIDPKYTAARSTLADEMDRLMFYMNYGDVELLHQREMMQANTTR